jgi:[acyl-carrier-protein] S-malonyltransferase
MHAALPANEAGACMALWRGRVSPATLARREQVQAECGLSVAIRRRENEEVLAGTPAAIARFVAELQPLNPNLIPLPVSVPSHSHHLAAAAAAFRQVLSQSSITAPQIAVLSGVDAAPVRSREQAINALSRQMDNTISWDGCMQTLAESGIDKAVELGPGNDLSRLLETGHENIPARAVADFMDYRALAVWLA